MRTLRRLTTVGALAVLGWSVFGAGCGSGSPSTSNPNDPNNPNNPNNPSGPSNPCGSMAGDACSGTPTPLGGVTFPWAVFDGTIPDVPTSTTGNTWYVDAKNGSDSNDGKSFATAKRTLSVALRLVKPGDTLLLGGGVYREYPYPDFEVLTGATADKRITIGSYGRGTGEPAIDGGLKPNQWTRVSGTTTVWQSSTTGMTAIPAANNQAHPPTPITQSMNSPVLGIYVNDGHGHESALREVAHGQLSSYGGALNAKYTNQNEANVTDHSNNWYYNVTTHTITADFGGTLGSGDPNAADISILYESHGYGNADCLPKLNQGNNYINFIGLTFRASSWGGPTTVGAAHDLLFDHCDIKFNGGHATSFGSANGVIGKNITVQYSRAWMNVLNNWPRFNNGNTSGGWPSALGWGALDNSQAIGNVVYMNGGEGLDITYTTSLDGTNPYVNSGNLIRHNVIYDNFSVNLYLVSASGITADQNFIFNHVEDKTQTFDGLLDGGGYGGDLERRIIPVNVGLGDEGGSSFNGGAYLRDIVLTNNIIVGGKRAILDWGEAIKTGLPTHSLKNCTIANNTIVLGADGLPDGSSGYGWQNGTQVADSSGDLNGVNVSSVFQNNLVVSTTGGSASTSDSFIMLNGHDTSGISVDYNLLSGPGDWYDDRYQIDKTQPHFNFVAWKAAYPVDAHSLNADAMLVDITEFTQTAAQKPVYDWSKAALKVGSPATGKGTDETFTTDFTGAPRTKGAYDIGAVNVH
jgi:hypothetical protein